MVGNSSENIDTWLENSKRNISPADLKSQLVEDYLEKQLKAGNVSFLNELDDTKEVPKDMKDYLKLRIKSSDAYKILSDDDIDSLVYLDVIPWVTAKITWLRTKRTALKNIFLREYNLSSNMYDKHVEKIIHSYDDEALDDLLEVWDIERKELLEEIFGKNMPEKKNLLQFINKFNLKSRLKKLSSEDKDRFDYTVSMIQSKNWYLETHDLEELFDIWIFTESEKQKLVTIFIPTMSLANARELGIISEIEETKIRNSYVEEGIDKYDLEKELPKSEIDVLKLKILSDLGSKDLMVETAKLSNFDAVLWKLIEAGELEKLIVWYNNVRYKAQEKVWWVETHRDFEKELSTRIWKLQAQKFRQGSTLAVKEKDTNTWQEHIFFFEIFNNGKTTGNISLKPKGHNKYDRYDSGKVWIRSFDEIIWIASNSFSQTGRDIIWFQVLDKFDLKKNIESWTIQVDNDAVEFLDKNSTEEVRQEIRDELQERKDELKADGKDGLEIEKDVLVRDLQEKQKYIFEDDDLLEVKNERILRQAIDNLDIEWKQFYFMKIRVSKQKNEMYSQ